MQISIGRKWEKLAILVCLPLLLTGCFLSPGKFTSALDLRKDGAFTFTYSGEIYMMGLSKLAGLADKADDAADFQPQPCYDDNTNERTCTTEEIDKQRSEWAESRQAKLEDDKRKTETFRGMMGGIDPADPQAGKEIADRLARQKGWKSVQYKGDGLFLVDFAITSRITHDFTFPVFEGFPMANPFVQIIPRDGNTIRIEAPGFSAQSASANPMAALLQDGGKDPGKDAPPAIPELDGMFTVTTDGAILANNTDEGPQRASSGQQLSWTINKRTQAAPTALIRIAN